MLLNTFSLSKCYIRISCPYLTQLPVHEKYLLRLQEQRQNHLITFFSKTTYYLRCSTEFAFSFSVLAASVLAYEHGSVRYTTVGDPVIK